MQIFVKTLTDKAITLKENNGPGCTPQRRSVIDHLGKSSRENRFQICQIASKLASFALGV